MKHSKTLEILFGADRLNELTSAFLAADAAADAADRQAREATAKARDLRAERDSIALDAAQLGIEFVRYMGDPATYARAVQPSPEARHRV